MSAVKLAMGHVQPKQWRFVTARNKYVLYGGARAGGKSWVVRFKAVTLCLKHSGISVIIIRRSFPEIKRNHLKHLLPLLNGIAKYNVQDKMFRFPNGSTLEFGYCDNDSDVNRYQGAEWDVIFIDEATLLEEAWVQAITACLRAPNEFPKRVYYTANPGGVSHGYFKRLFVDRKYQGAEDPGDYEFIQALPQDNLILMKMQPDYIKQLEALPYNVRKAWLHGSWEINSGAVFTEFRDNPDGYQNRRWSHVIEPFDIPEHWPIYRSMDWGYNSPFSIGWWAVGEGNVLYRILEWYGAGHEPDSGLHMAPETVFERVRNLEAQHPYLRFKQITGIADPACWGSQTGVSVAETASKMDVYFSKGDNKRIAGWLQMHYRLEFDENGKARMYFFNTCEDAIRTIPLLQYDKHNIEDVDTTGPDHIADETRYLCMARPVSPLKAVKQKLTIYDPLEQTA